MAQTPTEKESQEYEKWVEKEKREYEQWLKEKLPWATLEDIASMIGRNQDAPYFKLQDFLSPLLKRLGPLTTKVLVKDMVAAGVYSSIIKTIATTALENWLGLKEIGTSDYFDIEGVSDYLSPEVLRKAQRKIVLFLIRKSRQIEELQRTLPENNNQERGEKEQAIKLDTNALVAELNRLQKESHLFPATFIDELVKRLGLDYYLRYKQGKPPSGSPTSRDLWDTAAQVEGKALNRGQLMHLIWSGQEDAKNYLKGLLYSSEGGGLIYSSGSGDFILDSENQPMNLEMQRVGWPEWFRGYRLSKERAKHSQDQDFQDRMSRWQQLIIDFGGVPQ